VARRRVPAWRPAVQRSVGAAERESCPGGRPHGPGLDCSQWRGGCTARALHPARARRSHASDQAGCPRTGQRMSSWRSGRSRHRGYAPAAGDSARYPHPAAVSPTTPHAAPPAFPPPGRRFLRRAPCASRASRRGPPAAGVRRRNWGRARHRSRG